MDKTKFTLGKFSFPAFSQATVPLLRYLYYMYLCILKPLSLKIFRNTKFIILKAILRKQEVSVGIGAIYIGCFFKFQPHRR
jgi:hypothetical protein